MKYADKYPHVFFRSRLSRAGRLVAGARRIFAGLPASPCCGCGAPTYFAVRFVMLHPMCSTECRRKKITAPWPAARERSGVVRDGEKE